MIQNWAPVAVAIVTGVFSAPVWNYIQRRFGAAQSEIERLRKDVTQAAKAHQECEDKVFALTTRVAIVEHHHSSAFARWIADGQRRILWVNPKALVSVFGPMGVQRDDVEGHKLRDLVDPAVADAVDQLADAALTHDGLAAHSLIKLHPDLPMMHMVKVCTSGRDGELIYEALAFRMNDDDVMRGIGVMRNAKQREVSIDNLSGDSAK